MGEIKFSHLSVKFIFVILLHLFFSQTVEARMISCTFEGRNRLDGRTVVITGASFGLGLETARELYKRGGRVIMACRNLAKAEQAAADIRRSAEGLRNVGQLVIRELDLSSFDSVRKCANEILQTEPAIHFLVNNAGIMAVPKSLSRDGYEMQFATNHLGPFLFTLLLLPRIIGSAPARIVMLASVAHRLGDGKMHFDDINLDRGYSPWGAYGRSKSAKILFAFDLGRRLQGSGVTTYAVHPGLVGTELLGRSALNSYPTCLSRVAMSVIRRFEKTPVQGIQTILYCSLDDSCANETGLYYEECAASTPAYRARNRATAAKLWDESVRIVGLQNFNPFQRS